MGGFISKFTTQNEQRGRKFWEEGSKILENNKRDPLFIREIRVYYSFSSFWFMKIIFIHVKKVKINLKDTIRLYNIKDWNYLKYKGRWFRILGDPRFINLKYVENWMFRESHG